MDPTLESVLLGVISNALFSAIGLGMRWSKDKLVEMVARTFLAPPPPLKAALNSVRELTLPLSSTLNIGFGQCLQDPEVELIVRHIYTNKITDDGSVLTCAASEFKAYLSLNLGESSEVKSLSDALWVLLVEACSQALREALGNGDLRSLEQLNSLRQNVLLQELSAVKRRLDSLAVLDRPSIETILAFETTYRRVVGERHGRLTPTRFSAERRLPIDDIYVPPQFRPLKSRLDGRLSLPEFLTRTFRTVVVGSPGGGKSTLTEKICHDLSTHYAERLVAGRELTPVLVVLRDYGEEKRRSNCSIKRFIEMTVESQYQIQCPTGAVEYLLSYGRVLVIFDGLDELGDTVDRQQMRNEVESFCSVYPHVPVLITAREIGYEQAPLHSGFEVYRLDEMTMDQVTQYVTKWFRSDEELAPLEQTRLIDSFLIESDSITDLRTNPLMLALLCNIYRHEGYIPRNRPQVYKKCAEMLFERWDKVRRISVPFSFERDISPAVKSLAYWIFRDKSLQKGVTEPILVSQATNYLCPRRYADRDEAQRTAQAFIDFCCKGRAWVLSEAGVNSAGEPIYQFAHRTFLEYFAACHLVRTNHSAQDLLDDLMPYISQRDWDMVAQLAFQILDEEVSDAGEVLLTAILNASDSVGMPDRHGYLSFAVRCLAFLSPSQGVLEQIAWKCLADSVEVLAHGIDRWYELDLVEGLLRASRENRSFIARAITIYLPTSINSGNISTALAALDLAHQLQIPLFPDDRDFEDDEEPDDNSRRTSFLSELADYWTGVGHQVLASNAQEVRVLASKSLYAARVAVTHGLMTVRDLLVQHGTTALFCCCSNPHEHGVSLLPLCRSLIRAPYRGLYQNERWTTDTIVRDNLSAVGEYLIGLPLPWTDRIPDTRFGLDLPNPELTPVELQSADLFGLFCLMAAWSEQTGKCIDIPESAKRYPCYRAISILLAARFTDTIDALVPLEQCEFDERQRNLVINWTSGFVNLVADHTPDEQE